MLSVLLSSNMFSEALVILIIFLMLLLPDKESNHLLNGIKMKEMSSTLLKDFREEKLQSCVTVVPPTIFHAFDTEA